MRFAACVGSILILAAFIEASPVTVIKHGERAGRTGLSSLLNNADLRKARTQVADGLNEIEDALGALAPLATDDATKSLIQTAQDGRETAKTAVDEIGNNILANKDPNSGNNPQGTVIKGLTQVNSTIDGITAALINNEASKAPLQKFNNGISKAQTGGLAVLAAAGQTIDSTLAKGTGPTGNPKAGEGGSSLDKLTDTIGQALPDSVLDKAAPVVEAANSVKDALKSLFGKRSTTFLS